MTHRLCDASARAVVLFILLGSFGDGQATVERGFDKGLFLVNGFCSRGGGLDHVLRHDDNTAAVCDDPVAWRDRNAAAAYSGLPLADLREGATFRADVPCEYGQAERFDCIDIADCTVDDNPRDASLVESCAHKAAHEDCVAVPAAINDENVAGVCLFDHLFHRPGRAGVTANRVRGSSGSHSFIEWLDAAVNSLKGSSELPQAVTDGWRCPADPVIGRKAAWLLIFCDCGSELRIHKLSYFQKSEFLQAPSVQNTIVILSGK